MAHNPQHTGIREKRKFLSPKENTPDEAKNPSDNPMHPELYLSAISNTKGNTDFAKSNKFMVKLGSTYKSEGEVGGVGYSDDQPRKVQEMLLDVKAFVFPSKSIMTNDYQLYGPMVAIPYSVLYNDVTMTIRCRESHREREFFSKWQSKQIIDEFYDVNFLSSITKEMSIVQLGNPEGDNPTFEKYICTLHNAWPKTITEIPLDYGGDQVAEMSVIINFSHWSTTPVNKL
jgi:hypothetical protein